MESKPRLLVVGNDRKLVMPPGVKRPVESGTRTIQILQAPHPVLSGKSAPVTDVNSSVRDTAGVLMAICVQKGVSGIAAPQVGKPVRMIAVQYGAEVLLLINPEIAKKSEQTYESREQCLSVDRGKVTYAVRRHKLVKVVATRLDGRQFSIKGRDLFGAILQHEIDHLDGRMIDEGKKV